MIPLGLSPEGSLVVWTSDRRAWICQRDPCIARLNKHPGLAKRRFGRSANVDHHLMESVQAWRIAQVSRLLQRAYRDGQLIIGAQNTIDSGKKVSAICLSLDAGTQTKDRISSTNCRDRTFILPISSHQTGALFARGPRTVLGIRSGRTTQSLLDSLQRWDSLG